MSNNSPSEKSLEIAWSWSEQNEYKEPLADAYIYSCATISFLSDCGYFSHEAYTPTKIGDAAYRLRDMICRRILARIKKSQNMVHSEP